MSAALLDHLIHHDRNIPPEYTSPENYNEIQVIASKTFLSCMGHEATNFTSTSYIAHCIILYALSHGLQRCSDTVVESGLPEPAHYVDVIQIQ